MDHVYGQTSAARSWVEDAEIEIVAQQEDMSIAENPGSKTCWAENQLARKSIQGDVECYQRQSDQPSKVRRYVEWVKQETP